MRTWIDFNKTMSFQKWSRRASSWRDYANEFRWNLGKDHQTTASPSFPLDPEKLRRLLIRWPANYEWGPAAEFLDDLRSGMQRLARVEIVDLAQPYHSAIIQVVYNGKTYDIALDYTDIMDRIEKECLNQCSLYFKMQYCVRGYDSTEYDTAKIIPGGYINGHTEIYKYLPHVRRVAASKPPLYDVYGRFSLDYAKEVRSKAVRLLKEQQDFHFEGGLKKTRYSRFLLDVARSKLCIDLPGNGPLCFRLMDYLAAGACVIGPPHEALLHVPLEDRKHIVYTRDDLTDLVPLCAYYLDHDEEREAIGRNAREFYDSYLHRDQLARYYLNRILRCFP